MMEKKRFSVTLTPAFVEALDQLVEVGVYLDHQDVIRDSMRRLFEYHKIPLTIEEVSGYGK